MNKILIIIKSLNLYLKFILNFYNIIKYLSNIYIIIYSLLLFIEVKLIKLVTLVKQAT